MRDSNSRDAVTYTLAPVLRGEGRVRGSPAVDDPTDSAIERQHALVSLIRPTATFSPSTGEKGLCSCHAGSIVGLPHLKDGHATRWLRRCAGKVDTAQRKKKKRVARGDDSLQHTGFRCVDSPRHVAAARFDLGLAATHGEADGSGDAHRGQGHAARFRNDRRGGERGGRSGATVDHEAEGVLP